MKQLLIWFVYTLHIAEIMAHIFLSGLVVSVVAVGPSVRGLNPAEGDEFLRVITIRSTPSFGEVKPWAACRKILQHVKKSL
jgi:flagellar biosynthesis protein FlhB